MLRRSTQVNKRRTFISARRSSFLDLESTAAALAESEAKLFSSLESLRVLEAEHRELSAKYGSLLERFTKLKNDAVHTVWTYCPEKSSEFRFLPRLDESMGESSTTVGEYEIQKVIGKGQFSTVMAGVRRGGGAGSFSLTMRDAPSSSVIALALAQTPIARSSGGGGGGGGGVIPPCNTPLHSSVDAALGMDLAVPTDGTAALARRARIGALVSIKIIAKDQVTSLDAVKRVETELRALLELRGELLLLFCFEM